MIILASGSPRREELLRGAGLANFKIIPADIDEDLGEDGVPSDIVCEISKRKAQTVADRADKGDIIIGADTVVYIDGVVLGKPGDETDAFRMLSLLSGNGHVVYTGVTVIKDNMIITESVATTVRFRELNTDEIEAYIKTGEPMDKAGAYGVQGIGALLVEKIDGDFYNVMGLPLGKLYEMLRQAGVNLLQRE